ncbi:MAG: glycosyltransferase [Flavobacteriales bacterium]|nr:glycosyltransferase [Flavobacteriales bacterium]
MADFSIITPVLNQVSTIETCIISVAQQRVDVEHIIIDGGSTDGTIDIIRKCENNLSYWKSEPDSGQSQAINKGLERATGKYFNWLNADDQLTKNALQKVLLSASEMTTAIIGKCEHIDAKRQTLEVGSARIWKTIEATLGNYSMGQPSLFYRTSVVKDLGGLNENLHLCMDMDLWFRFLLKHGQNDIVVTEDILSFFLVHQESKSIQSYKEMECEKYGLYHALLSQNKQAEVLTEFFKEYAIPKYVVYEREKPLNKTELLSNFAWHLMVRAYKNKNLERCKDYFEIVKNGQRLSETDKLMWKARLAANNLLRK